MLLTYRYKLRPTKAQRAAFVQFAGNRRFVWNWALAECKRYYALHGKSKDFGKLSAELTQLKKQPEFEWLKLGHAQSLQEALADLKKAYQAFFAWTKKKAGKKFGPPRYKEKGKCVESFRFPQYVTLHGNRVYLPKIGRVRLFLSRSVVGAIKTANVKQVGGDWFVTLVVEDGKDQPAKAVDVEDAVGVDLGLTTFATCSDGDRIASPKFFRAAERAIAKLQRVVSRRTKGSNRRRKAIRKLAKAHAKVRERRNDFAQKAANRVLAKASVVCVETLSIAGMAKTKLAKSVLDAGWRMFLHCLGYKADRRSDRVVQAIGRFEPSSKRCSVCGVVKESLALSERSWACVCGARHDRDHNASLNIKAAGQSALREQSREFVEPTSDGGYPAVGDETRIPRQ